MNWLIVKLDLLCRKLVGVPMVHLAVWLSLFRMLHFILLGMERFVFLNINWHFKRLRDNFVVYILHFISVSIDMLAPKYNYYLDDTNFFHLKHPKLLIHVDFPKHQTYQRTLWFEQLVLFKQSSSWLSLERAYGYIIQFWKEGFDKLFWSVKGIIFLFVSFDFVSVIIFNLFYFTLIVL